ncbi:uncharacterized protein LOC127158102 [Labeo rohita]|uniref:uncharacterized protein LOC127158102 n=1 Tax=Labeo rohita TaxID=84645 RepID=UPI0021E25FE8|nr:uncharacterized protein LOC127158102 [Labeo rohita]
MEFRVFLSCVLLTTDAVDAPVLTLTLNLSSPDHCNFTCNGSNIITSFIYDSSSCTQEEVTTSDNHTLRLSCSGDSIMCNYSNPVSWKSDTKKINELCTVHHHNQGPERQQAKEASLHLLWLIPICAFTVGLFVVVGKKKKGVLKNEQTIYAEVDDRIKPQKPLEMKEKSENPQTVYDTARDPGQTDATIHTTPNNEPMNEGASLKGTGKTDAPVTVYCTIQQKSNPLKDDTENTIYAVVNKQPVGYESAHPQSE